jgi:signal transduction histidine kinase
VYSSIIDAGQLVKTQGQMQRAKVAVESTKEELRDLAARLLTIQDEERRRISREIHDDLAQRLALVTIKIMSILKVIPATRTDLHGQLTEIEQATASLSGHAEDCP